MIKIITTSLLCTSLSLAVYSQQPGSIQEKSIWAPGNIKIDAKLNEWGDALQAHNKTTDVYYTLANDDENLYLVVKSTDPINNNKIIGGGITLTINKTGKKKDKDACAVIFPLIDMAAMRNQIIAMGTAGGGTSRADMDSAAVSNLRKKALKMVKEIKLVGFTDVRDSVVSIYNEYGIKAAIDYDTKGNLAYEMAIPLKYIHLLTADSKEFNYNIKLNGMDLDALFPGSSNGGGINPNSGRNNGVSAAANAASGIPNTLMQLQTLISPTDFWGKYTLAKK